MELQRFPLDRQFLNMDLNVWLQTPTVRWNWILKPPVWVPQDYHKPIMVRVVSSVTEYELLPPWVDFAKKEPPFTIRLRVNRLAMYYGGNIVLPNFLIVLGCFSAFAIAPVNVADRLAVSITLMLAAVAFRFVIESMLPKVTYLTLMDYYIMVGFLALSLLICENAIVGISHVGAVAKYIDYGFGVVFGLMWTIIHVVAVICLARKDFLRISWEEMDRIDQEEDKDSEFIPADKNKMKGNAQSEERVKEWEERKAMTPFERAKSYNEEHGFPMEVDEEDEDQDFN
jgi:hypothetical protein